MASFNKVILVGRLTRDPEVRTTTSGLKVAEFTIAVDRTFGKTETGEKKTDFFRCKAWRQRADFVEQYVGKGRLVVVEGRIEINEYTDREGQKRSSTDISVDTMDTLERSDRPGDGVPQSGGGAEENRGGSSRDDNGYFPDDEPAPVRVSRPAQAAQPAPAKPAPRPATAAPAQPARRAAPVDDDFDDSDPFADE